MRIEIKIGGLNGTLRKLESRFSDHIKDREKVISSFKDIRKRTYDVHGGYSDLHTAISHIDGRIAKEERKKAHAHEAKKRTASLLDLSRRVDAQVADRVDQKRHAFYDRFPHLKPESIKKEERKWYEKIWDWVCDTGKNIVNCVKKAWNWIKETYTKHKKIFDTIFIAAFAIFAVVSTILTAGAAGAALAGLLGCMGIASSVAAAIATTVVVVSVVATTGSAILNIIDIWCEIDHPVFNTFQKVFDIAAIVADVTLGGAELIVAIKKGVSKFLIKHGDDVAETVGSIASHSADDVAESLAKNADDIASTAGKNADLVEDIGKVGDPKNSIFGEKPRDFYDSNIDNEELRNIVLGKGGDNGDRYAIFKKYAEIGDGSIMDAAKYEKLNNCKIGGYSHTQRCEDSLKSLNTWLEKYEGLGGALKFTDKTHELTDLKIATHLRDRLIDTLGPQTIGQTGKAAVSIANELRENIGKYLSRFL